MNRLLLAAVLLAGTALVAPASAATINVLDVGASGTTTIQGIVDPGPVVVPGLTGTLFVKYDGVTNNANGTQTWNFDYTVTNTSSGAVSQSRISSFGFGTTPDVLPNGVSSTGVFDQALAPTKGFPNVGGAMAVIEMCYSAGNNTCSGGGGEFKGQSTSGTFAMTFASAMNSLSLDAALFRFQDINSPGFADSGVGINTGVQITPLATPIPLPAALFLSGMVGIGLLRRATKKKQTLGA